MGARKMGVLRNLELKLEGLVEGAFSRAFKARVQPVELARKLAKEMESYKTVSISRVYVPNEYTVFLSREDRRQFQAYEPALLEELSAHLLEHAARENLALLTRPKVSFETDKRLRMGEFGIQARLVEPARDEREEASQGELGATMVYSAARMKQQAEEAVAPSKPTSRAMLISDGKSFVIDRPRAVIGRSQRCDYVITDPNVSRRHFELQLRGADWYLTDLNSTNGVLVNGRRVKSSRLAPGDEIVVGTSSLKFDVD
jgi:FHA domain-containing protein